MKMKVFVNFPHILYVFVHVHLHFIIKLIRIHLSACLSACLFISIILQYTYFFVLSWLGVDGNLDCVHRYTNHKIMFAMSIKIIRFRVHFSCLLTQFVQNLLIFLSSLLCCWFRSRNFRVDIEDNSFHSYDR